MWDAGHFLWRPIGLFLYNVLGPLLPAGQPPLLKIAECLIGIQYSVRLDQRSPVLFHRPASGSIALGCFRTWPARFCVSTRFSITRMPATPTSPVSCCLTLSVRLLLSTAASSATPSPSAARWAGIALAASALMWLPYVLSFPAVILLAACWTPDNAVLDQFQPPSLRPSRLRRGPLLRCQSCSSPPLLATASFPLSALLELAWRHQARSRTLTESVPHAPWTRPFLHLHGGRHPVQTIPASRSVCGRHPADSFGNQPLQVGGDLPSFFHVLRWGFSAPALEGSL